MKTDALNTCENYKSVLYRNYRSTHNAHLYGDISLSSISKNFPIWKYFYQHHLPANRKATILEIGCGDGSFVYFLQQMGYESVMGIDLSAEQVKIGEQLGITNLMVEDIHRFLTNLKTSYDLIIARDVVEHFTHQEAFELLNLISASLTNGGKFIMQVPNGEGLFYSSIYYGDYTHELAFTSSSVRQLFLNAGFNQCNSYATGPFPYTWKGFIRKILWSVKVFIHRFWKMVETGNSSGIFSSNLIAVGIK